ncbi:MAG: serine hydrolase [Gammaproteobacteria bacterium]
MTRTVRAALAIPALAASLALGSAGPAVCAPLAVEQVAQYDLAGDVARAMETFDVPGVAIAIVKDGQVVAARGFGVRKRGEPAPVDGRTLFEIASNSKGFTAALLAMLVDEGRLAWNDPVVKHLPDFQMYDPYVTRELTVRDLLVHRSGLGLGAGDLLWWPTTTLSSDDIIHRLRYVRPATSFRSAYAYDNLLYIVAAKIIERQTGKPWGQVVRERILTPLGMRATTTSLAENAGNRNVAGAHSVIDDKVVPVRQFPVPNAAGAVGVNTNAEDVARWMMALLDGGQAGGKRLWSAAQARELWTEQTPMAINEPAAILLDTKPNFLSYGLGFQLRDYRGLKVVQHGGALQGFYSRLVMVPQARLGIAILTNAENGSVLTALQYRLLDHYLAGGGADWIALSKAAADAARAKARAAVGSAQAGRAAQSHPSLALTAYEGEYRDPWYGVVSIRAEEGRQVMRFSNTPDLVGDLEHFQYDTFIVRWRQRNLNADAYVTFSLNHDGSIERMKMAPVSSETDFSDAFADLAFVPVRAGKAEDAKGR